MKKLTTEEIYQSGLRVSRRYIFARTIQGKVLLAFCKTILLKLGFDKEAASAMAISLISTLRIEAERSSVKRIDEKDLGRILSKAYQEADRYYKGHGKDKPNIDELVRSGEMAKALWEAKTSLMKEGQKWEFRILPSVKTEQDMQRLVKDLAVKNAIPGA